MKKNNLPKEVLEVLTADETTFDDYRTITSFISYFLDLKDRDKKLYGKLIRALSLLGGVSEEVLTEKFVDTVVETVVGKEGTDG